jgi:2-amino-4-hydroxy-6-hydroxymethyldihydropteridine diphosphokinase
MSTAYIALGANLPFEGRSPQQTLARAVTALSDAGLAPHALSGVWRSPAWPPSDQPDYYNAVVAVHTRGHSPQSLYRQLVTIEQQFGRERRERWAARTLDLDIVAIDDLTGVFEGIELPHPRMHERAFVLAPLAEIAPNWRDPRLDQSAAQLSAALGGEIERVGGLEAA